MGIPTAKPPLICRYHYAKIRIIKSRNTTQNQEKSNRSWRTKQSTRKVFINNYFRPYLHLSWFSLWRIIIEEHK